MSNLRKITFNMPEEVYEDLRELAFIQKRTITSYLVDWAKQGLENEHKKAEKLKELEKTL